MTLLGYWLLIGYVTGLLGFVFDMSRGDIPSSEELESGQLGAALLGPVAIPTLIWYIVRRLTK